MIVKELGIANLNEILELKKDEFLEKSRNITLDSYLTILSNYLREELGKTLYIYGVYDERLVAILGNKMVFRNNELGSVLNMMYTITKYRNQGLQRDYLIPYFYKKNQEMGIKRIESESQENKVVEHLLIKDALLVKNSIYYEKEIDSSFKLNLPEDYMVVVETYFKNSLMVVLVDKNKKELLSASLEINSEVPRPEMMSFKNGVLNFKYFDDSTTNNYLSYLISFVTEFLYRKGIHKLIINSENISIEVLEDLDFKKNEYLYINNHINKAINLR